MTTSTAKADKDTNSARRLAHSALGFLKACAASVRAFLEELVRRAGLPNLLTCLRGLFAAGIVGVFLLDAQIAHILAPLLFLAAGITDYLDGHFARAWRQDTRLGRMLDPIADKLLVCAALLVLTSTGAIGGLSLFAAFIILSREILVSGLRQYLATLKVAMPVSPLAKWKTAMQMVAIGVLLAGPVGDAIVPGVTTIGLVLLWVAAILTLYTGAQYVRASSAHLMEPDAKPPRRRRKTKSAS